MDRKKFVVIIAVILLVLFLSGCKGFTRKGANADESAINRQVYSGTQGLEIDFMQNLPPNEIYDSSNLHIVAELRNRGTRDVSGRLYLTGLDTNIIRGIDTEKYFGPIEARDRYNIEGGYEVLEFESSSIDLPRGTDVLPVDVSLVTCYDYETLANPLVCVDPNIENILNKDRACQVKSVSMSGGQGAPVGVTKVDVESTGRKAIFSITVQNLGKGEVAETSRYCPFNLQYDDLNKVAYDVTLSGMPPEKCSPRNPLRLSDGRGLITCTFNIPSQNRFAYETPLQIKLRYGYTDAVSKKVTIKNLE